MSNTAIKWVQIIIFYASTMAVGGCALATFALYKADMRHDAWLGFVFMLLFAGISVAYFRAALVKEPPE